MTRTERQDVVGIDIGGTRIKAALVDSDGGVVRDHVRPTPQGLGAHLVETVVDVVATLGGEGRPIGVVVPGLVDDDRGVGVWSANLGWSDLPIRDLIRGSLGVPVGVGHDVRAGLLGEHHHGAARDCDDVIFLALGTGLAAAAMSGGQVVSGSPWSGEVGHLVVRPDGDVCGCGARGCLETVSSARAIGVDYTRRSGSAAPVGADRVAALVSSGDELATLVWQEALDCLAQAVAPVVTTLGSRRVVIGGGLVGAAETLLGPFRAALGARLPARLGVDVVPAVLGDRAAALGAAVLAREACVSP